MPIANLEKEPTLADQLTEMFIRINKLIEASNRQERAIGYLALRMSRFDGEVPFYVLDKINSLLAGKDV